MLFLKIQSTHAQTPICKGSNFNLYFPQGSNLVIQHPKTEFLPEFKLNITILSGDLNGTNGEITVYRTSGELKFESQNQTTLDVPEAVIFVDGLKYERRTTIQSGDTVIIKWGIPVFEPYVPIGFIFGVSGLLGLFIGPCYCIYKLKQRDYYQGAINGFLITLIGICLVLAWLWG